MTFAEFNSLVSGIVWGPPMMILLIGVGLYLTLRLGFIQFRGFRRGVRIVSGADEEGSEGEISHFQALSAALSATIGVSDTMNGLMAAPNLISLVMLSPVVAATTREYLGA